MTKRTGTDVDSKNLARIFQELGFIVELKKDATCRQLRDVNCYTVAAIKISKSEILTFRITTTL